MKLVRILFFLIILSNICYAHDNIRKIHTTGTSKIRVQAQYSIIYTELKFITKQMDTSYNQLNESLFKVIKNLKKIGLTDKEITKSIIRQGAEYKWQNNTKILSGYFSSCTMQLKINDINKLYPVYKELANYNELTIQGTEYGRNDEFKLRNNELKKALYNARKKAELMANTLNEEVGQVLIIRESGSENYNPKNMYLKSETSGKTGGTFGMIDIFASVSVEFELK